MDQTVSPLSDVFFQALEAFCRKRHIRRLSLFGSVVRGDFRPDSDIDVLVEFEPGAQPHAARTDRSLSASG